MFSIGFDEAKLQSVEAYLKTVKLLRNYQLATQDPEYSQVITA